MSRERLTANIKTRVTRGMKRGFKRLAKAGPLDESQHQREAFRIYLAAHSAQNGKAKAV